MKRGTRGDGSSRRQVTEKKIVCCWVNYAPVAVDFSLLFLALRVIWFKLFYSLRYQSVVSNFF